MSATSLGMRAARWLAVVIIVGVATAAFVLSFAALRGLGVEAHVEARLAWLLPVVVDGTIILATVGWLVMTDHPAHRRYFLAMLAAGAAVSVAGNALHAVYAGGSLSGWVCALVAAIAPISLLADTHGLAVLFRAAQHDSTSAAVAVVESVAESTPAPAKGARSRKPVARRDPAVMARAAAMRREGASYARIGQVLGISARTAANYVRSTTTPDKPVRAAESQRALPVTPVRPVTVRPVPAVRPVSMPVLGGDR